MALVHCKGHDVVSDQYRSYWLLKTREFDWYQEAV